MVEATTYQLYIHLRRRVRIEPGRLGAHVLPAGWYVYTGSARRNLAARVRRHLRRDKPRHWHIDWLLTHSAARVVHVRLHCAGECRVNAGTGGSIPVPGFGASDCRAHCGSHLRYLGGARPAVVPAASSQQRVDPDTIAHG